MLSGSFGTQSGTNVQQSLSNNNVIESARILVALRRRPLLQGVVALMAHMCIGLPTAVGCDCAAPPPCQAYFSANTIFVGTAIEALETNDGRISSARMQVDRAYKGTSQKTLSLRTDTACSNPDLLVGRQYLIYANRLENSEVASTGCSSRQVRYAQDDLKYLDGFSDAAPTSSIFGNVIRRDRAPGDQPAVGGQVEVRGPTR